MFVAFDLADAALLEALAIAAEWSALILSLALAGAIYVVSKVAYRV